MILRHFGQELQNSPRLLHLHARLYRYANEKSKPRRGLMVKFNQGIKLTSVLFFNSVYLYFFVDGLIVI